MLLQLEVFFSIHLLGVKPCLILLYFTWEPIIIQHYFINPISCTCSTPPAALNNEAANAAASTSSSVMTVQIQSTDYEAWWMRIEIFTSNYALAKTDG